MGRWVSAWALMVSLVLGSGIWGPTKAFASSKRALPSETGSRSRLPDSVLAVIGEKRLITQGDLARASRAAADSLTPEEGRRFLDLLIDRELLAERAAEEPWNWTPAESAGYEALSDRLLVRAALDSMLEMTRARRVRQGSPALDSQELGIVVRDSVVAAMGVAFDEALLGRLAIAWAALPRPSSDSSAVAQLRALGANPRLAAADSNAVITRAGGGDYRASELLLSWARLSPAYRPRIESPEQIKDLVKNGLFERALRAGARDGALARRPDIVGVLALAREEIAIQHLIARDVIGTIRPDARAIEGFYRAHREDWALPLRVRVLRLAAPGRAEADRMALALRSAAQAEKLTDLARRAGLDYVSEWTASEGEPFTRAIAAGPGVVLGPEPHQGEWWVTRVLEVRPARVRPFEEVRDQAEVRWRASEAERRTHELCARLRRSTGVRSNDEALRRLGLPDRSETSAIDP